MAAQRKKIGILFTYSEGWIGGTYYFMNLVSALLMLPDDRKPEIVVLSDNEDSFQKLKETNYPYLHFLNSRFNYSLVERIINRIGRILLQRNIIHKGYDKNQLPVLFGYYEQLFQHKCDRKLYWIPDFQEKYFPQYFHQQGIEQRKNRHQELASREVDVVFSSNDALTDFNTFYPASK